MKTFVTVLLLLYSFVLGGCNMDGNEQRVSSKRHSAQADVGGYQIQVELASSHPTLAENNKRLIIRKNMAPLFSGDFADPGGFANFYVVPKGKKLYVVDGLMNGVVINTSNNEVSPKFEPFEVSGELDESMTGKFMFVDKPTREYRWIPKEVSTKSQSNSQLDTDAKSAGQLGR